MLTFEKVLEIFKDYLALDTELEVCKSRYGYIRVEFNEIGDILDYCSGVVCRTPEELFDVLLDDFQGYEEIRLTKGRETQPRMNWKQSVFSVKGIWIVERRR